MSSLQARLPCVYVRSLSCAIHHLIIYSPKSLIKFLEGIKNMKDFRCFLTALYILCWKVTSDDANKNLDCFKQANDKATAHPKSFSGLLACTAESATQEEDAKPLYWLAIRAKKISCLGPARKRYLLCHKINPLLTQLVRSRWLDIGLALFCVISSRSLNY